MSLLSFTIAAGTWNSLRYDRGLDLKLTLDLLVEEFEEYHDAEDVTGALDATCDMAFICAGSLWKAGYPVCVESLNSLVLLAEAQLVETSFSELASGYLHTLTHLKGEFLTIAVVYPLLASCYVHACMLLNSKEAGEAALEAIVVSNNTKTAERIAAGSKYSPAGKGPNYVPPTETLTKLVNEARLHGRINY